jgi:hypothetical protein
MPCQTRVPRPSLPLFTHRRVAGGVRGSGVEERRESGLGADGDDALVVDPDALEEVTQELAAGLEVPLLVPEEREVVEDRAGLVEVGRGSGGELVEFGVDLVAAGDVPGAGEVAELIEVLESAAALQKLLALADGLSAVALVGLGEAAQDLVAEYGTGLEVGDELDDLLLDDVGGG